MVMYPFRMKISITGSIAVGKSKVFNIIKNIFKDEADYIDLDILTKEMYEDEIVKEFLINNFNTDKREEISKIVFLNKEKLLILTEYLHKKIINEMKIRMKKSLKKFIFIDVPLLYEANLENLFDKNILVYVNKEIQLERLMNRNNFTKKEAMIRINSQIDIEEKKKKTKYIINNENSEIDTFINTLDCISKIIMEETNEYS